MLLVLLLFVQILLINLFGGLSNDHVEIDGKYCLYKNLSETCHHPIVKIQTKYPFLIVHIHERKEKLEGRRNIHVIKPFFWHDIPSLWNTTTAASLVEFTLHNISGGIIENHSSLGFSLKKNGILHVQHLHHEQPLTFKRFHHSTYCNISNILPGKWYYDENYLVRDENKWETCPNYHVKFPVLECPSYYALQYFPDSHCTILPLRKSLYYLHDYLINNDNISRKFELYSASASGRKKNNTNVLVASKYPVEEGESDNVYFYITGDSLTRQLAVSAECEIQSNLEGLKSVKYLSKTSSVLKVYWKLNQFLRSDLPCHLSCLTNSTYFVTDGQKASSEYFPFPCKGCPDGRRITGEAKDNPELFTYFSYLKDIPSSVRVLLLNAGPWYIKRFHVLDGNKEFRETLQALVYYLAMIQKEREYQLDIYFLALPSVDADLPDYVSLEFTGYKEKNEILYDVFSPHATSSYNLSVTIIANHQFYQKKALQGKENVFSSDNLHYCFPGTFSPPSFLFETIVHHHVMKLMSKEKENRKNGRRN